VHEKFVFPLSGRQGRVLLPTFEPPKSQTTNSSLPFGTRQAMKSEFASLVSPEHHSCISSSSILHRGCMLTLRDGKFMPFSDLNVSQPSTDVRNELVVLEKYISWFCKEKVRGKIAACLSWSYVNSFTNFGTRRKFEHCRRLEYF